MANSQAKISRRWTECRAELFVEVSLEQSNVLQSTTVCEREFQAGIVRGKKEFL